MNRLCRLLLVYFIGLAVFGFLAPPCSAQQFAVGALGPLPEQCPPKYPGLGPYVKNFRGLPVALASAAFAIVTQQPRWAPVTFVGGYMISKIAADLLELYGITEVTPPVKRTQACYNYMQTFFPASGEREDFSEGLWGPENDPLTFDLVESDKNRETADADTATERKFEFLYQRLDLQRRVDQAVAENREMPAVLDAGCGNGSFLKFLSGKGLRVVGLTLSEKQAELVRQKVPKAQVFVLDYRRRASGFVGKFSAVTALGSTEHLCSSIGSLKTDGAAANCIATLSHTWANLRDYLIPDDESSLYITALTRNLDHHWGVKDMALGFSLERLFGGYYPSWSTVVAAVERAGLAFAGKDHTRNLTAHYHWSSVVKLREGGSWRVKWRHNVGEKISDTLNAIAYYPNFVDFWVAYAANAWLNHLGGIQSRPLTPLQAEEASSHLKYFQLRPKQAKP